MSDRSAGAILDPLGVVLDLDDNEQVVEVVVVAKVRRFDGNGPASLLVANSMDLDWIAQRGLLAAAQDVLRAPEQGDG